MAFVLRNAPDLAAKHAAYPYQLDAIRALQDLPYAAIFHEQGLGKTKIAVDLALLWLKADVVETVLVVTKKSLIENWRKEVEEHCHLTPHVLRGNRRENGAALNSPGLLYLANYEVIGSNTTIFRMFLQTCRVGCILDESQKIKNPEAALTKKFHELASGFERRIIMTGTPVANRPHDIWSQIKFLDGGEALGLSFDRFKAEMDLPKEEGGTLSSGRSSDDEGQSHADLA
ncbi:MAG: ATP-dependent helicase, partial [Gemmatimonadetes bacterium]|nr:ATP-dependent helicase [Gemmatimonadota bacterium]